MSLYWFLYKFQDFLAPLTENSKVKYTHKWSISSQFKTSLCYPVTQTKQK